MTALTLLPLADAQAAPARKTQGGAAVARLDLSRLVTEAVSALAGRLVRLVETQNHPPGQQGSDKTREGSGWDPNGGGPGPRP